MRLLTWWRQWLWQWYRCRTGIEPFRGGTGNDTKKCHCRHTVNKPVQNTLHDDFHWRKNLIIFFVAATVSTRLNAPFTRCGSGNDFFCYNRAKNVHTVWLRQWQITIKTISLPLPQPRRIGSEPIYLWHHCHCCFRCCTVWMTPLVTMESNCYKTYCGKKAIAAAIPCERTFRLGEPTSLRTLVHRPHSFTWLTLCLYS